MIKVIMPVCFSLVALLFSPSAKATGIFSDDTFLLAKAVSMGTNSSITVSVVKVTGNDKDPENPATLRGVNTSKNIIAAPDPSCAEASHCLTCQSGARFAECIKCPMGRQLTSDMKCIPCPLGCHVPDKTCVKDEDTSQSCP